MSTLDSHHPHDDRDDRLRAHLRSADPAASLAPADQATVTGLTRTAMRATGPTPSTDRTRVPQLLAAAAVVVVAGLGVWAVAGPDDSDDVGPSVALDPAPTTVATPTPSGGATAPGAGADTTTLLRVPGTSSAKCMVPNAEVLRGQDLAFKGTVTGVDGPAVDLDTTEVYAGAVSEEVRVQAPSTEMSLMLSGVQFEVGTTYLVSATGGQVTLCGLTAEVTPELAALYAEAYGR